MSKQNTPASGKSYELSAISPEIRLNLSYGTCSRPVNFRLAVFSLRFLVHCSPVMMLPTIAATLAMGALAWAGGPDTAPTNKPVPVKKTPTAVIRKTSISSSTARPAAGATASARRSSKAPVVRTTWRTRQTAPTPDRYREIQEALAARGYLSADDANGTWGPSSTEALKRFQAEQSLESSGKIDSLSLIALGLGPKHDSAALVPRTVDANVQSELGHN